MTIVFLNFDRDEDERLLCVEQEEAEKGKGMYHKELLFKYCSYLPYCCHVLYSFNIFLHSGQTVRAVFPLFPPKLPLNFANVEHKVQTVTEK